MNPRRSRSRVAWLLAGVIAFGAFFVGASNLGRVETGAWSERASFAEAREMAEGRHRYGIVEYTHFPNGPVYVIAGLMRAGVEVPTMRLLPLSLAALAIGGLAFALLSWTSRWSVRVWILLASAVFVVQPAHASWMGALHEHSYAPSLALFAMATAAWGRGTRSWLLFPLGFVAGWIGYDWLPGQALAVLAVRWLVLARDRDVDLWQAGAAAVVDTLKFTSGACLAILAHLAQLAAFFGSLDVALRDLLGSAAARAGAEGAALTDPEYGSSIQESLEQLKRSYARRPEVMEVLGPGFSFEDPSRTRLAALLFHLFLHPQWTSAGLLALGAAGGVVLTAVELGRAARADGVTRRALGRTLTTAAIAVAIAVATAVVWSVSMTQHAISHMHMLPRHGLLLVATSIAVPVLLLPDAAARAHPADAVFDTWGRLLRTALVYLIFPLMTVLVGVHAVLRPG
jgi:hypothetical protein